MNFGNVIDMVREQVMTFKSTDLVFRDGDSGDARNAETPVVSVSIARLVNNAQAIMAARYKYAVLNTTIATAIGTREYALPTGILEIISVWQGNLPRLRKSTITSLDDEFPKWRATTNGQAYRYYLNGTVTIGLDVPPVSVGTLNLNYVAAPADLAARTDAIQYLPLPYHPMMGYLAAILASEIDTGNERAVGRGKLCQARYDLLEHELLGMIEERMQNADDDKLELKPSGGQA